MSNLIQTPVEARNAYARAVARTAPPEELANAQRALAAAKIAAAIEKALAVAPPLTDDQCAALAGLLTGGAK